MSNEKAEVHHQEDGLDPTFVNEVQAASAHMKLRGQKLKAALSFVAGTGFTLFGYDQGVMSALLTANQFEKVFPQVKTPTLQSFLVAIYEIGCLAGALLTLVIGDKFGRKRTIALGCFIMTIGAIIQATSFSYAQIIVARIITGIGNGLNTSTVPAYHAECSPPHQRGSLIMIEGSLITLGIMISYWIDFALFWASGSSAQWRVPIALQISFAAIVAFALPILPESPRWLMKAGRPAEALAVISALEDKPHTDSTVRTTFQAIKEAVALEGSTTLDKSGSSQKVSLSELFTGGRSQNFRRVSLGVIIQCFQQITGINLITYYATILFERLGINDVKSRILAACNGTEYFLASLVAIFLIDRVGRRKLMLFGGIGQCLTMVLLAVLGSINNSAADIVSAVLLFVFNSFFAVGWLGMTWLYPAEIVGLRMRGPANALSTASNWTFNFLVVMITGPAFQNISWGTYIVFAALNAFIVPIVYFFFPETAGRSLEDMDVVFALAYLEKVSPVTVSLRKDVPSAGSPEAERILGINTSSTSGSEEVLSRGFEEVEEKQESS
ncbi:general substrate transporter [Lentinula raphanica]|nr:general substrate transporter [Lentinula raphanica]